MAPKDRIARQRSAVKRFRAAAQKLRSRLAWAVKKRTVHRKKLKKARADYRRSRHHPTFQSYMLNGHPGNITPELKDAIARAVVIHNSYVTATTDGTHVPTSFHYPSNNRLHGYTDTLGHAADFGGPLSAYGGFYAAEKKRGCGHYDELFGPGSGYCDGKTSRTGAAPDIPNHCHDAPVHVP